MQTESSSMTATTTTTMEKKEASRRKWIATNNSASTNTTSSKVPYTSTRLADEYEMDIDGAKEDLECQKRLTTEKTEQTLSFSVAADRHFAMNPRS